MKNRFRLLVGCLTAAAMLSAGNADAAFLLRITAPNGTFNPAVAGTHVPSGTTFSVNATGSMFTAQTAGATLTSGGNLSLFGDDGGGTQDGYEYLTNFTVTETTSGFFVNTLRLNYSLDQPINLPTPLTPLPLTVLIQRTGFVNNNPILFGSVTYTEPGGGGSSSFTAFISSGPSNSSTFGGPNSGVYVGGGFLTPSPTISLTLNVSQVINENLQFSGSFLQTTPSPAPATVVAVLAGLPALAGLIRLRRKVTA